MPAQIDGIDLRRCLGEVLLDVELLEIPERRVLLVRLRLDREMKDLVQPVVDPPLVPGHGLGADPLGDPQAVEDLERALGIRDPPRGNACSSHRGVAVENDHRDAAKAEVERKGHSGETGADDHDGIRRHLGRVELGRAAERMLHEAVRRERGGRIEPDGHGVTPRLRVVGVLGSLTDHAPSSQTPIGSRASRLPPLAGARRSRWCKASGVTDFSWQEADRLWARLAEARDTAGEEDGEAFLARLVLLLAHEVGDTGRVLAAIDAAIEAGRAAGEQ